MTVQTRPKRDSAMDKQVRVDTDLGDLSLLSYCRILLPLFVASCLLVRLLVNTSVCH